MTTVIRIGDKIDLLEFPFGVFTCGLWLCFFPLPFAFVFQAS
jgi:hypothetical protein